MLFLNVKLAFRNLLRNKIYSFLIIGWFCNRFCRLYHNRVVMLNRDFMIMAAVAFVSATPVSVIIMHKWLESFKYKTDLSWWVFFGAGLIALFMTLIAVSLQSVKAANTKSG